MANMSAQTPRDTTPRQQTLAPLTSRQSSAYALEAPGQGRSALIEQSHQRCSALGLKRIERPDFEPLIRSDLSVARDRNNRLSTHAAPVMELLAEQIVNTESMIVLTDANGTILHTVGDDDFLERAGKVALSPGVSWAEHSKGTNAIGTTLFEETATLVHASEHFMHANNFLTCSAAPIFDPRGNILGVLDVTGDQRSYHQHTMGLVRMSARMIENHWLTDDFKHRMRLHFHHRVEFIGTLLEGIVVVGMDGKLLGANRSALDQLNISGAALRMQSVTSLFGTSVPAVIDHFRAPLAVPMTLALADGRQFYAQARFSHASLHTVGSAVADDPPASAAATAAVSATASANAAAPLQAAAPDSTAAATRPAAPAQRPSGLQYMLTGDAQLKLVVDKIQRVLDRDIPLLILGETGTGKELLARAVHHDSARSRHPFVGVNCASIPESLIEAELFGYEEGAFTGARRKGAPGRILQANGGTLFLDEIGDMPLSLQARLLRVLQERQVTPLGSNKSISVDVAVIAATHCNLREMIEKHSFREDLYYRLNGLAVRLPALRERSDLMPLALRMLAAECPGVAPRLSQRVIGYFKGYQWPGNLRQLSNVLRTAAVMAAGEPLITDDHLSDDFLEDVRRPSAGAATSAEPVAMLRVPVPVAAAPVLPPTTFAQAHDGRPRGSESTTTTTATTTASAEPGPAPHSGPPADATSPPPAAVAFSTAPASSKTLGEHEIEMIRAALDAANGNISEASKRLGISRNTIYRKLRWNQP
jgi:sigma-54 dependent transcriptional regulator, acetoin dehydrogenase operon transcriptional activator AcoR